MKSTPLPYFKKMVSIFLAAGLLLSVPQASAAQQDAYIDHVLHHVNQPGVPHDLQERFNEVHREMKVTMHEFSFNTGDGKKLHDYISLMTHIDKKLDACVKAATGSLHTHFVKLHKLLQRFIRLIKQHQNDPYYVIAVKLNSAPDLKGLIPAAAGWSEESVVIEALKRRCS